LGRAFPPTGAAMLRYDAGRVDGPSAPGVGPRISRAPQDLPQGLALRLVPVQLPSLRSGDRAEWQGDAMTPQVAQQPTDAAQGGELREDPVDHVPDLLVGIELQAGIGPDDVARRWLTQPLAAAGATEATGLHPLLNLVQFDPSGEALHIQKDAIIEIP